MQNLLEADAEDDEEAHRNPTATRPKTISRGTMPMTPAKMVSIGITAIPSITKSTGTMTTMPTMKTTGTMSKTPPRIRPPPLSLRTRTLATEPVLIDLVSPTITNEADQNQPSAPPEPKTPTNHPTLARF